jgi:hypothetical protein
MALRDMGVLSDRLLQVVYQAPHSAQALQQEGSLSRVVRNVQHRGQSHRHGRAVIGGDRLDEVDEAPGRIIEGYYLVRLLHHRCDGSSAGPPLPGP